MPRRSSGAGRGAAQLEPAAVHAVAGAVDVAAGDALVRLHQVEALAPPGARARRARTTSRATGCRRGTDRRAATRRAPQPSALARDQRDLGARALERRQRARDEALGAAVGVVALAHEGQPSPSRAARAPRRAPRRPAGRVRHSLTLPPPQPSWPQGGRCAWWSPRGASTFHGPHSFSPLGPNSATVGVPIAAARCIGIESTPTKSCARAVSAPSSLSESLPARLSGLRLRLVEDLVDERRSRRARR